MNLGPDHFTVASHIAQITVLCAVFVAGLVGIARRGFGGLVPIRVLRGAIVMAACYAIERVYYLLARLLQPQGLDLWNLHPAPAVLSGLVCLGATMLLVPLVQAAIARPTKANPFPRFGGQPLNFVFLIVGVAVFAIWIGAYWALKQ